VPTKALVASAKLAHQMRHADAFGLEPHEPKISPRAVMESMRAARHAIEHHDAPEKFRALGIDVIEGNARFKSSDTVEVNGRELVAKDIVIATGSRTSVPPIDGLEERGYLDHASFLDRDEFPRSILILGGGYIGIEFAQIFRRFGLDVTVAEMSDDIVAKEDHEVIARVRKILESEGIVLRTGIPLKSVRDIKEEAVFVASGRRGNIEELNLDLAGVKTNKSYVVVNEYLQTSAPRIWACGDVHGGLQFTHVAAYEAIKLVRNMLFPGRSRVQYDDIPWALFTDPEVGHIGMTEHEARAKFGDNVRTYKVEMDDVDRAVVDRTTQGFIKFVCDAKGKILGAHALCSNASTLIEEIVLARKKGMRISELAQLVSAYPSLADSVQKSASLYYQNLQTSPLGALARRIAAWSQ
jgi:pyruvate/2-oxoglutarate dehydrogenase complex dihydrolipoamide dehydrogenase (E3) component